MAIPKEYLDSNSDFGFSAIDDEGVIQTPAPVVTSKEISEPIVERIRNLEINMGEVLTILERIENAGTPLDTDEYKALIEKERLRVEELKNKSIVHWFRKLFYR